MTAVAILNFVFGGLGAIGNLIAFATLGLISAGLDILKDKIEEAGGLENAEPEVVEAYNVAMNTLSYGTIFFLIGVLIAILQITAGVGIIGQKKTLGFLLSNVWAIASIAMTIIWMSIIGFGAFGLITGTAWPIIVLILVNGPFKAKFVK
jgi:hypothetical protein